VYVCMCVCVYVCMCVCVYDLHMKKRDVIDLSQMHAHTQGNEVYTCTRIHTQHTHIGVRACMRVWCIRNQVAPLPKWTFAQYGSTQCILKCRCEWHQLCRYLVVACTIDNVQFEVLTMSSSCLHTCMCCGCLHLGYLITCAPLAHTHAYTDMRVLCVHARARAYLVALCMSRHLG